jgi:3-oxoacyl-[acyl-carrier protein] reductase
MSVIGLQQSLSRLLAPAVRANAVLPGAHETRRIRNLMQAAVDRGEFDSDDDGLADRVAGIPVDRTGDPLDLGSVVAFRCSREARYLNGVAIPVDGGEHRSTP